VGYKVEDPLLERARAAWSHPALVRRGCASGGVPPAAPSQAGARPVLSTRLPCLPYRRNREQPRCAAYGQARGGNAATLHRRRSRCCCFSTRRFPVAVAVGALSQSL